MWYRYNNELYNLKGIYRVEIEDAPVKLYPFRLVFYNKKMNPRYSISFETQFDALHELTIIEKLLTK